jgi:hypothetical protein
MMVRRVLPFAMDGHPSKSATDTLALLASILDPRHAMLADIMATDKHKIGSQSRLSNYAE